ncbi:hypothetical protein NGG06_11970 [Enterococcus faecium]|uniref:hypothetical protein n=1 Tax=Enterococcus faecium TaxID=1352 RepID=UPI002DB95C88|nr:hypothetical protein [Enterococcus faecium]MEB7478114.1 hypothetical protein [Enterococcus faecium]MEB8315184.1 hypothetical protein [Enterococcus faecium]MEB8450622.1 hypothetical protein [Enterococcus faecium]NTQ20449.1 hypothetical protein [Enterococcus faecium]
MESFVSLNLTNNISKYSLKKLITIMPFLIYNTVIFKNKNAKSLYNNGESTKNKKIITLLKKQMKDQVLLDLILSSLEGI